MSGFIEKSAPRLLYLSMMSGSLSHELKLAGIRRYCSLRGWEAIPILREDVTPENLSDILAKYRPVGCVVDGVGHRTFLKPSQFQGIPVSFIAYPWAIAGKYPNFHFDSAVVAEAAFRDLSLGKPPCYAAVGHPYSWNWSRLRVRWFREQAERAGAQCFTFPGRSPSEEESNADFAARLVPWLARLPEHCAVFAACDSAAVVVAQAAIAARRAIPRSLTLLSVDNFPEVCDNADPPISSLQLDFEREGFIAARAAMEGVSRDPNDNRDRLGPLMVVRRKSTRGGGRYEPWILQAVDVIRREACDGLGVADLVARFPLSRRNFERRFREAMGHGIYDEILHTRLEKACILLSQTDAPIFSIPDFCGFRTYWALDDLFRTRFRCGMREWRAKNRRR